MVQVHYNKLHISALFMLCEIYDGLAVHVEQKAAGVPKMTICNLRSHIWTLLLPSKVVLPYTELE